MVADSTEGVVQTRRQFIRSAAAIAGAIAAFPESIQRAMAIEPAPGSTFLDAEHVVILMQENRSFDHCFGSLQGVRGFADPRAIALPDGNPVWVQSDRAGKSFAPFRLDIHDTQATWMGSLPHNWADQQDARNGGTHDGWIHAMRSEHNAYADMPLTMGYYTREDVPFYYAFADAFTICDQNFCSSITGATPNRLHLWTGTIRAKQAADSPANVRNQDVDYGTWADWPTFPERLEQHGISWKVYQNELGVPSGLTSDEAAWLTNFGDNPLEYFSKYSVRLSATHRNGLESRISQQKTQIATLKKQLFEAKNESDRRKLGKRSEEADADLKELEHEKALWTPEIARKLSSESKSLHDSAFSTNAGDPGHRTLSQLTYRDGEAERHMTAPKGDVLFQFRKDVHHDKLPTVSWLVAPERFSDHPSSPWYGAWYVSQVLDILTHNPEVWRKTVFILTYDENDGYFDHVPPFVAPNPSMPDSGKVSKGIDAALEYVQLSDDQKRAHAGSARGGPIGLGFRVPMVIASPWSRGGCVCSQVFDHTSVIQFVETLLTHRTGKKIREPNISAWRRTVCGDLTAAFNGAEDSHTTPPFPPRDAFLEMIHKAQFKGLPSDFQALTSDELSQIRSGVTTRLPLQEPGVRKACALPYELVAEGALDKDQKSVAIRLEARKAFFKDGAAGAPFIAFSLGKQTFYVRNYAVLAGDHVEDSWPLSDSGEYHLRIHGPNGFYREMIGDAHDPDVELTVEPMADMSGKLRVTAKRRESEPALTMNVVDNSYNTGSKKISLSVDKPASLTLDTEMSFGWYDTTINFGGRYARRYAGRVENGKSTFTDPLMGRAVKQV